MNTRALKHRCDDVVDLTSDPDTPGALRATGPDVHAALRHAGAPPAAASPAGSSPVVLSPDRSPGVSILARLQGLAAHSAPVSREPPALQATEQPFGLEDGLQRSGDHAELHHRPAGMSECLARRHADVSPGPGDVPERRLRRAGLAPGLAGAPERTGLEQEPPGQAGPQQRPAPQGELPPRRAGRSRQAAGAKRPRQAMRSLYECGQGDQERSGDPLSPAGAGMSRPLRSVHQLPAPVLRGRSQGTPTRLLPAMQPFWGLSSLVVREDVYVLRATDTLC